MHLRKIVLFEKSTQKFSNFYFKIARNCSAAGDSDPRPPVFLYYINTTRLKKYPRLSCSFLNEFTKLCNQLCISYLKTYPLSLEVRILDLQMPLFCRKVLRRTMGRQACKNFCTTFFCIKQGNF